MKTILVFAFLYCLISTIVAAPPQYNKYQTKTEETKPHIVNYEHNNNGLGPYNFSYILSDGTHREERGTFLDSKDPNSPLIVEGSYSYKGPDDVVYKVNYIADELGYRIISENPQKLHSRF